MPDKRNRATHAARTADQQHSTVVPFVALRRTRRRRGSSCRFIGHGDPHAGLVLAAATGDQSGHISRLESGIDVDDRHVGGTAVEHAQQRGQATETGSIADARRHGDHGTIDVATHDAGQGTFQARPPPPPHPRRAACPGASAGDADRRPPRRECTVTATPIHSSVSRASSATGRSLVPAVTTTTRPTIGGRLRRRYQAKRLPDDVVASGGKLRQQTLSLLARRPA